MRASVSIIDDSTRRPKKDAYPLPRMEDCLHSLGDAKVITSLSCTAGYWQVLLRPADREKIAFTTHAGIYH